MANLLQRIGGSAAVVLAPFIVNAGQVGATEPCFKKPSPTFPGNPQELVNKSNKETVSLPTSSPTNPTPKRDTDIVNLSKPNSFSVTRMPIEVSQVSQVSQQEKQPSNNSPILPPSRSDAAKAIADLQGDINKNNSQLVQGLQKHNESQSRLLQEILNRTKN
jgi:hypothetical protein